MGRKTKIQWTEATWNPVSGCSKASIGCKNCYAETMAKRLKSMRAMGYENGFEVTMHPKTLDYPKGIKKPTMFFVCSMGDLFHETIPFGYIDKVMETIESTPRHTYQLLTKRPGTMVDFFKWRDWQIPTNVWLGNTVEHAMYYDRAVLLSSMEKASVRFLSCEPMLSDLSDIPLKNIDWVICGGESGPKARPIDPDWVHRLRNTCSKDGVPFFFKQWGTWGPDGVKRNKKANGSLLDGEIVQEWPKIIQNK